MSAPSRRPHGSFRPQRLIPRYAPLLDIASRVPGGLHLTTSVLRPLIKDRVVSASDSPSIEQLRATRVAISGYPRTGTTFLQTLINLAYDDDSACWKNHNALALTWYAENCAVAGITLREPENTAISNAIYHGDEPSADLMRFRLKSYCAWHREVLRTVRRQPISIFRFSEFTVVPSSTLASLCSDATRIDLTEDEVRKALTEERQQAELPEAQRNFPSGSRDGLKSAFQSLFESRRVRSAYEEAREIFLELDSLSQGPHSAQSLEQSPTNRHSR